MIYKLSKFRDEVTSIHVLDDDRSFIKAIPFDPDNTYYQEYLKWVDEGGIPEPAEEAE